MFAAVPSAHWRGIGGRLSEFCRGSSQLLYFLPFAGACRPWCDRPPGEINA